MTLGERIKEFRHMEGLSQEGLAEKLNVSRQAITKWESDNGVPDVDNLIALSRLMGITLDELVLGEQKDVEVIKEVAIKQRTNNCKVYLIAVGGFSFAEICLFISLILNIANGNDLAAIVNLINILVLLIPITIHLKKYFEIKGRGE